MLQISLLELVLLGVDRGIVGTAHRLSSRRKARVAAARSAPRRTAAAVARCGLARPRDRGRRADGFALPPLLQLRDVPPVRVLRREHGAPPLRYPSSTAWRSAAILAMLLWLVRDCAARSVSRLATAGTLACWSPRAGCWCGAGAAARRRRRRLALRPGEHRAPRSREHRADRRIRARTHGAAAARGGAQRPAEDWRASLPPDAPNHFLINIRPDEQAQPARVLRGTRRARAGAVPDDPSAPDADQRQADRTSCTFDRRSWPGTSPSAKQNLTWAAEPQSDNKHRGGQVVDAGGCRQSRWSRSRPNTRRSSASSSATADVRHCRGDRSRSRWRACARCSGTASSRISSWCSRPACSMAQPART